MEIAVAIAAVVGVGVNGVIAAMALKDQLQLPYILNKDQRTILETLAKHSEWILSAERLIQVIFEHAEYQMLIQERSRELEPLTRRYRYELSYLERKGAVVACFIPALGQDFDPSEVRYRITHRGWRKLGKWLNNPLKDL